jgi:hypothetical protein
MIAAPLFVIGAWLLRVFSQLSTIDYQPLLTIAGM